MLPKIIKKVLKSIYKQDTISPNFMDSYQNVWHVVVYDEGYTRFTVFTYGDSNSDFGSWDELVEWAHNVYHIGHDLPCYDCSGFTYMSNYRVVDLPKFGNACVVIFYYSVDV